jgi:arsenate reductase
MRSMSLLFGLCSLVISVCTQPHAQDLAAGSSSAPPRVVFVCEHGAVKSLVAMVYFNHRAQERGLAYRAIARGTAPEPSVPSPVSEGLLADGFDVSGYKPRQFNATDLDHASLVVSFDQNVADIAGARARYLRWDDLPEVLTNFSAAAMKSSGMSMR